MEKVLIIRDPETNALRVEHTCASIADVVLLLARAQAQLVEIANQKKSPIATPTAEQARQFGLLGTPVGGTLPRNHGG